MNYLLSIVGAVLVAALGCWLAANFIPAGTPRVIAQVASVLAGFGGGFGGFRVLGR